MSDKSENNLKYSGVVLGNFTCSWTVKSFSELGKTVRSFRNDRNLFIQDTPWNLSLTTRRSTSSDIETVIFSLSNRSRSVCLKLSVMFLDTEGKKICNKYKECENGSTVGIEMIERKALISELLDSDLVIYVDASWSSSCARRTIPDSNGYKINVIDKFFPDACSYMKLVEDMKQLLNETKSADASILVGETDIPVHSNILSARSKVFRAMFEHDTTEASTRVVSITDFDAVSVKALLQFIYSGHVDDLNVELALELLRAGDKYQMDDLKTFCSNFLMSHMDDKNIGNILYVADLSSADRLRQSAIEYFCSNNCVFDFEKFVLLKDRNDLIWDILKPLKLMK